MLLQCARTGKRLQWTWKNAVCHDADNIMRGIVIDGQLVFSTSSCIQFTSEVMGFRQIEFVQSKSENDCDVAEV